MSNYIYLIEKEKADIARLWYANIKDALIVGSICCLLYLILNAVFIQEGLEQKERLIKLNKIAIQQMSILQDVEHRKVLK